MALRSPPSPSPIFSLFSFTDQAARAQKGKFREMKINSLTTNLLQFHNDRIENLSRNIFTLHCTHKATKRYNILSPQGYDLDA